MKEYTIAEILHYAADKKLASKKEQCWNYGGSKEKFSCCAVNAAVWDLYNRYEPYDIVRDNFIASIRKGMEEMGCPVKSLDAFDDEGEFNAENQQARYAWLKFAAIIAEEQGV